MTFVRTIKTQAAFGLSQSSLSGYEIVALGTFAPPYFETVAPPI